MNLRKNSAGTGENVSWIQCKQQEWRLDELFLKILFNEEIIPFQNIDTQLNSLITSKYVPSRLNTHARTHKTILNSNTKNPIQ